MAPIDIVISLINAYKATVEASKSNHDDVSYLIKEGKTEACNELVAQLEGFKKLFN